MDSDDFLPFNDTEQTDFQPNSCSSPQKSWEPKKNYKNNWNPSPRHRGNNRTSFYNSPNNSQRNRSFQGFQKRNSNRSFNKSNSFRSDGFDSSINDSHSENNFANYLHPSFMENPWERLEKQLNDRELKSDT